MSPLNLPKGSVRAILALFVVVFFCFYAWFKGTDKELLVLTTAVITYYFGVRNGRDEALKAAVKSECPYLPELTAAGIISREVETDGPSTATDSK